MTSISIGMFRCFMFIRLLYCVISLLVIYQCQYIDSLDQKIYYRDDLYPEETNKKNLLIKIEAEDNFELPNIDFRLSNVFPSPVYEESVDFTFRIPIPITLSIDPSVQTNVIFSEKIDFKNGNTYEFYLPPNSYYASIENGSLYRGLRFNPMELNIVLFMFGYNYDRREKGSYIERNPSPITPCYEVMSNERQGKFGYSCPHINIEKGKTTEIIIKIGKRKWNGFWHIFFSKFILGIIILGPISNHGGYYFHRDYEIEVITTDSN